MIHTSLSKFISHCSTTVLKPWWKNRRTLFLFLLIPGCGSFHVRGNIVQQVYPWPGGYGLSCPSHLNGTFKLAVKKSERQIDFLPLSTYSASALSFCPLAKKKKTPSLPWKLCFQCHISLPGVSRAQINGWSFSKMADKGTTSVVTSSSTPLTTRSSLSCRWRERERKREREREREVGWWAKGKQGEHNKGRK